MKKDQDQLTPQQLVEKINDEIMGVVPCRAHCDEGLHDEYLEYRGNGYSEAIVFGSWCLWDSENSSMYEEDGDTRIPLETYVRRQLARVIEQTLRLAKIARFDMRRASLTPTAVGEEVIVGDALDQLARACDALDQAVKTQNLAGGQAADISAAVQCAGVAQDARALLARAAGGE